MRSLRPAFAILSTATLLSLGACRQDAAPPAPADTAPAPAESAPATASAPTAPPDAATAAASAAPAAPAAPVAAVIASADGEKAGIRIEVTELKRGSGETVSLKFALINDTDEDLSIASNYLGEGISNDYASVGGIHLVDAVGKKKYMVVRDSERNCVCSDRVKEIPARSRANLWAKYPAPPAGTNVVSIVVPHFSPMDDVTIAQ